jgi:uncharacterized protein (DUF2252 family)
MNSAGRGIAPKDRLHFLEDSRRSKMARSAHAYVRGNTLKFYEWIHAIPKHSLPEGPPIWICGDCHVGNLGPVADSDGHVEIEIRDLDQTVIGNPAHDLIRLGLSLATAARGSDLPGVTTARMIERMLAGYEKALSVPRQAPKLAKGEVRPIDKILRQSTKRRWRHLAKERIEDVKPTIPLGRRFWALAPAERIAIDELFTSPEACALVTNLHQADVENIKVLDAAYWLKGCSSLGRLRFAVLLGVGRHHQHYSLIDIKEAVSAAAPAARRFHSKEDFGARVVTGARALSPYLGERMLAARLLRRPVVVRELMPQDLKLEIDRLTCEEAVIAAEYLAGVVGKAHGRQMDRATRMHWRAELKRNRSKTLEAPGWMWKAVVELVASHEAGYLEHCRRYAMA